MNMTNFILIRDRAREVTNQLDRYHFRLMALECQITKLVGEDNYILLEKHRCEIELIREVSAHMDYVIIHHDLDFRYFKEWMNTIPEIANLIDYSGLRNYHDLKAKLMELLKYRLSSWMVGMWPHRDKVTTLFEKRELVKQERKLYHTLSQMV